MGLQDAGAQLGEEVGGLLGVGVGEDDDREAAEEGDGEGGDEPRVDEGDVHGDGLAARYERLGDRGLRAVARLQGGAGVDGELGGAGGAGGVRDQGGVLGRHRHGGDPGDSGERGELGGVLVAAGGEQDLPGLLEDRGGQFGLQLVLVGEQVGLVGTAYEFGDGLAVELRRQQHRDGADAGHGAGQQGDVEAVGLVDDDPAAGPYVGGPEPRGHVVDQVGHLGHGRPAPQARGYVQVVIEDHDVRRVLSRGPLEERSEPDSLVPDALQNHRLDLPK